MAQPILLSFKAVDANGKTATIPVRLPSTTTLAQIATTAVGFATALDALTGCAIQTTAEVTLPVDVSTATLKGDPVADSVVTDGHILSFNAANTDYRWSVRIPWVQRDNVDGETLTVVNQDVQDVITAYTAGVGADPDPCDGYGNDLTSFLTWRHSPRTK